MIRWATSLVFAAAVAASLLRPPQPAHQPAPAKESASAAAVSPQSATSLLHDSRTSPGDLEVGGELAGVAAGASRYIRYEDLLTLPQETYTIADDTNFHGQTEISGIALTTLAHLFGQARHSDLIVAICYDKYRSNYPSDYLAAHHPILVLKVNGKLRDQWPPSEYGGALGPYLISHPTFKPSFKILSHEDEPQIPFGVTRIDFRTQSVVFGAIEPGTAWTEASPVGQGFRIAKQDCFRCHGLDGEGGERASRSWLVLAAWAATDATRFEQYIRDPKSIQACSLMAAHPTYDDATLAALTAYFKTFAATRPNKKAASTAH
jgi:mono/diheme cytochrome c family protein